MKTHFFILLFLLGSFSLQGQSARNYSKGKVNKGSLTQAASLKRKGSNYKYFSWFSYYILRRHYVNPAVKRSIEGGYKRCAKVLPNIQFRTMEASKKGGGKMWPHITHQNGLSVDFMVPLIKKGKPKRWLDRTGIWHYTLGFDKKGRWKLNKRVSIDWDAVGFHILSLDKEARKQGLYIKKVILKVELQALLFRSKYGKELKRRGIYFVRKLPNAIDNLHDDHYHIDFAWR
ncbi:MAG: replication initiation protein [Bacteroidota bacterium]